MYWLEAWTTKESSVRVWVRKLSFFTRDLYLVGSGWRRESLEWRLMFKGSGVTTFLKEGKPESWRRSFVNFSWLNTSLSSIRNNWVHPNLQYQRFCEDVTLKIGCGNIVISDDNIIYIDNHIRDRSISCLDEE